MAWMIDLRRILSSTRQRRDLALARGLHVIEAVVRLIIEGFAMRKRVARKRTQRRARAAAEVP